MSGNNERKIDFPRCGCEVGAYWVVMKPNLLKGLGFHPDESTMIDNHKIYNMVTRRLQKAHLKKIVAVECDVCDRLATEEELKRIIEVAIKIFDEEWLKYNERE